MALGDAQINIGRGYIREFQWLHYADWSATTPIIFTILGLLAGVSWTEIVFYIGCGACRGGVAGEDSKFGGTPQQAARDPLSLHLPLICTPPTRFPDPQRCCTWVPCLRAPCPLA